MMLYTYYLEAVQEMSPQAVSTMLTISNVVPRYASSEGHEKTEPCNKIIRLKTKSKSRCSLTFDEKEWIPASTGTV